MMDPVHPQLHSSLLRSRLAPTPSGFLHVGNAFSFVLTWLLTRYYRGTLHLRIDDLDAVRFRSEYLADIFENLRWLGLDYDSGPQNEEDFLTRFSQQLRISQFEQILRRLRQTNGVYACTCSRADIQAVSGSSRYPGTCRHKGLDLDQPEVAWRVRVPEGTEVGVTDFTGVHYAVRLDQEMGDFIVRRRDGIPAYQIASLSDDLRYGINLIVRGADLIASTAAQLFLAEMLSETAFLHTQFYHHPLLMDDRGNKLSKSAGSMSLQHWKKQSPKPEAVFRQVAQQLHVDDKDIQSIEDLLRLFEPGALPVAIGGNSR